MDRFQKLHVFLEDCLANPSPSLAQKLHVKLERARSSFVSLFQIAPKNAKERESLQKGAFTYLPTGTAYPVSEQLVQEIVKLSDVLSCSEDYAASLVSFGINVKAWNVNSSRAEGGLAVHLNERIALLRSLQAIWRGALSADEQVISSGLQPIFEREAEEIIKSTSNKPGAKSWLQNLLKALDDDQATIDQLSNQAGANTSLVIASSSSTGVLSPEMQQHRLQKLREEKNAIAQLFFLIGAAGQFDAESLLSLIQSLSSSAADDVYSTYLAVAVLSALDVSSEPSAAQVQTMIDGSKHIERVKSTLESTWTNASFRPVVQLAFALMWEYASRALRLDMVDQADAFAWQSIQNGAFESLGRSVLACRRDAKVEQMWSSIGREFVLPRVQIESWFEEYILDQADLLTTRVISLKTSMLRKLRNREEDVVASSHRGGGHRSSRAGQEERSNEQAHHLEALFLSLATIYHDSPDGAVKFWDVTASEGPNRLAAFLRWGSESRPAGMMRAYYEMLASLATGPTCATCAFEYLMADQNDSAVLAPASPSCAWSALFGALEFYQSNLPDRPPESGANAEGVSGEMPPEEVALLRSFVRLLCQVVRHSDIARATLFDSQRHRPVNTLFALLARPVPIELKASLLDALAAFGRPGGSFGVEAAKNIWNVLEQSQILPTLALSEGRDARGGAGLSAGRFLLAGPDSLSLSGGIFTELEEVEAPNKIYPESTAFVRLLSELIHTPVSFENVRKGFEVDTQSIPETLGSPHREPGLGPYTRFVLDDVLLKLGSREFLDSRERWIVNDECLKFLEKALASFDLEPFLSHLSASGSSSTDTAPTSRLLFHPGFDVLTRILSNDELLASITTVPTAGIDSILSNKAGTPVFTACMLRCLRILNRVLDVQAAFLEVYLPALAESGLAISRERLARLKSVAPLDQLMLYHSEAIVQTALLVACKDDDIAVNAVRFLSKIAESPHFDVTQRFAGQSKAKLNRLVGLLQSSSETLTIIDAFAQRLDEPVTDSEVQGDSDAPRSVRQTIRTAILDLLLRHTQVHCHAPNIAHLVLGLNVLARPEHLEIEDPDVPDTQRTSLHVILDILAQNVPEDDDSKDYKREPSFSAQCYKLVGQLCLHPYTSGALSRYLRNRERFFYAQSTALPFSLPAANIGSLGEVSFSDGRTVVTSCDAVCSVLDAQTSLMDSIALEVSVLAQGNDERRLGELVKALLENPSLLRDESTGLYEKGAFEQNLPRLLEVFYSFDFAWTDEIDAPERSLHHLASVSFESCLKPDRLGCYVYDFKSVLGLLVSARRELQNRGLLSSSTQEDEFKQETKALIETLITDNHRRQIRHGRLMALQAWRALVDVVVVKGFDLLPSDTRPLLLLDLLTAILPPLGNQDADSDIGDIFSSVVLLVMTRLREEGLRRGAGDVEGSTPLVSPERLHHVLRLLVQAIVQSGSAPSVRGNVYAAVLNYLQFCGTGAAEDFRTEHDTMSMISDDTMSVSGSVISAKAKATKRGPLQTGNLTILQSSIDRLLPTICRDASSGNQVWRTVAFTLLDALVRLAHEGRAIAKVLTIMTKHGFLQIFVASLKEADVELQEALRPDPPSLNALYVYEAQTTFLIRLASTSDGARKLFGADILTKLAICDFLGARPQADEAAMELDGFVPPASERHHQLLCPALELVVGLLVSLGPETTKATRQAVTFVENQREVLLSALRDCTLGPSLRRLKEARLVVSLLATILPSVSDDDLSTPSTFGGLHTATVALSAKICGPRRSLGKIVPSSDSEREDDSYLALGLSHGQESVFSDKLNTTLEQAQTSLLTYLMVATKRQSGSSAFRPVWLPTMDLPRSTMPAATMGIAISFIEELVVLVQQRLADYRSLREKVEKSDFVDFEAAFDFSDATDLTSDERRQRIMIEVEQLEAKTGTKVSCSLHLLEMSLLLFWRHCSFYLDLERGSLSSSMTTEGGNIGVSRPDVGLGLAETMRSRSTPSSGTLPTVFPSIFDRDQLRSHVGDRFRNVYQSLSRLNFEEEDGALEGSIKSSQSFLELASRKILDVLRLD